MADRPTADQLEAGRRHPTVPTPVSIYGFVEMLDLHAAIQGWALDIGRPDTILDVELWADGARLASCRTGIVRADVAAEFNVSANPGFSFPADTMEAIAATLGSRRPGRLEVRVAGSPAALPVKPGAGTAGRPSAPARGRTPTDDLLQRVALLRAEAAELRSRPFRPLPDNGIGFIEAAAIDELGLVWVIGWMAKDAVVDRSVMILDGSKFAAGFAYAVAPREDLPDTAIGFIGVVQSDWHPSRSSKCYFFLGDRRPCYLQGLLPLNLITKAEFVEHCRPLWARARIGHAEALKALLQKGSSWDVVSQELVDERAAIDSLLLLPGFGGFASGWVLPPTKRVDRMLLKVGNSVLASNPACTSFKPRPDLAGFYPGADLMLASAGFTTAFVGDHRDGSTADCILKVLYDDGSSSNHAIAAATTRRLGRSISYRTALSLFPSISSEPFFRQFAAAIREDLRVGLGHIHPFVVQRSASAVVVTASGSRADIAYMFDQMILACRRIDTGIGIVILAENDAHRDTIVRMTRDLQKSSSRPISLLFVPDRRMTAYLLPELAEMTGVEKFLFVDGMATLAKTGWDAVPLLDGRLVFFDMLDPTRSDGEGQIGFGCFAWNIAEFAHWLAMQDILIGGLTLHRPSPEFLRGTRRVPRAAYRLSLPAPSAFDQHINQLASSH